MLWLTVISVMLWGNSITRAAELNNNLIVNPSFELIEDGMPVGWILDVWNQDPAATKAHAVTLREDLMANVYSGDASVVIENTLPNDAKWVQKVVVKPKTTYRLAAWVKVADASKTTKGANVSTLNVIETSKDWTDTVGRWQMVELYGKTGSKQDELHVMVRLGGYGSLNTGKVWIDDVSLVEKKPPSGVKVISFEPQKPAKAVSAGSSPDVSALPIMAKAVLFAVLFAVMVVWGIRRPENRFLQSMKGVGWKIAMVLIGAFLLRLLIAFKNPGYPADMATFIAWALHAADVGLSGFYTDTIFADYPPGYIYVLFIIGQIANGLGFDPGGEQIRLLVRIPAILADLAICALLLRIGLKRGDGRIGFWLAVLYALNPSVWINSASWGQVDSIFTLALIGSLLLVTSGRTNMAAMLFAITVLIKPQALIFTPVFVFPLLIRGEWRKIGTSLLSGMAVFVALVTPFAINQSPLWIVNLYKTTLQSYPYATLNAFNLFALTGGNWVSNAERTLGLSYTAWGTIFILAVTVASVVIFWRRRGHSLVRSKSNGPTNSNLISKKPDATALALVALLLIVVVFVLGVKMHERYLYPAVALSILAYLMVKDRRLLTLSLGFSLTHYINVAYVLEFGQQNVSVVPVRDSVLLMISGANLLLLGYLVWVCYDVLLKGRVLPLSNLVTENDLALVTNGTTQVNDTASAETGDSLGTKRLFTKRDWQLLGILMAVYSALALYNLGSFKAPQTVWEPDRNGLEVQFDFGTPLQIAKVNVFPGVGEGKYRIEFSRDGQNWNDSTPIDANYTKNFVWITNNIQVNARYARLTVESVGGMLHELAFYETGKDVPTAVQVLNDKRVDKGGPLDPRHLVDEPDQTVFKPSYLYGTYFDEIYHARTAYEHLHGIKPYETTHPPLGKLLISVGIWLFGMNPFGWRIVGTLFGIAMIPLLYVFAKRLFGGTRWAFIAAFLFTFDFMHMAQTRISTIDVYGVFFILLMFYYMYKYVMMNFYEQPFKKTLWPLCASGFWFGIGAASKWIVLYGGAGLAFLLFYSLYERYREYEIAKQWMIRTPHSKQLDVPNKVLLETYRHRIAQFSKRTWTTLAVCVLSFVIVPVIIYSLSFLPALTSKGETLSVKRLVEYQTSMYDYHSKLKATHDFGTPWYEWPVMVRPIWFYSGSNVPEGQKSSIVSMGNPAIWWFGIAAIVLAIVIARRQKHKGMLVVLTAYFAQFLPWMLVSRLTFIYHYFAMVPFMILAIVYVFRTWSDHTTAARKWIYAYMALALVLFAMFFPVLTGLEVNKNYVDYVLRWFPSWYF
jgi:Gpi18-like mannosyltransferase